MKQQCIVKGCTELAIQELPVGGGSISLAAFYCAAHLKEKIDSGEFDPIQVPIPKD